MEKRYCEDCIWFKDSDLPGKPFCENAAIVVDPKVIQDARIDSKSRKWE